MKWLCFVGLIGLAALMNRVEANSLKDYGPPQEGSVRIIRDKFGVPHIIAGDLRSLFFGVGYCQAEDQMENLYMNMLRGQGRSAEYEGMSALPLDHLVRVLDLPGRAAGQYQTLNSEDRVALDAFASGVNAYITSNRNNIPDWVQMITPEQVMAFSDYVDVIFSTSHCQGDLARAGIRLAQWNRLPDWDAASIGSNQFAVAPHRSEHGSAMLSMDPHLPHSGFFRWYEMHLVGPDINIMGACFYGLPFIGMGRTDRSAWCMTVNGPDLGDVFTFDVDPTDPTQIKGLNGWEKFEISSETHRVKTPSGVTEISLPRQGSPVGPIMATKDGVAYAFAVPLSDTPSRSTQLLNMGRARNVQEFKKSLEPLGLVMFNILYADVDGDIFIISNSRLPKRDTRIDSKSLRPGDQEWARWKGFHSVSELPQVLNPPCGYLMNTNSGPQNVTEDVAPRPEDFPAYFMSQQSNSRSRRLSALLSSDQSITWDEMHGYATDTHLLAADTYVPKIVSAIEAIAQDYPDDQPILAEIGKVLSAWDKRTDVHSRGAVLFLMIAKSKDFQAALTENDDKALVQALLKPAVMVKTQFGSMDCPWSDYSRIRRGDIEMGIAGNGAQEAVLDRMGMTALRPTSGEEKGGRRFCGGGTSYAMIIDFKEPVRAMSILPFGVSENSKSPHFADQLPLYVEGKYKPVWFWPHEISENCASDVVLTAQ